MSQNTMIPREAIGPMIAAIVNRHTVSMFALLWFLLWFQNGCN